MLKKKSLFIICLSFCFAASAFFLWRSLPLASPLHLKIYDTLLKIEYKHTPRPESLNNILLLSIDSDTISQMEHRWPFPRSDFVQVIENIKRAEPLVIALDFIFLGKSSVEEDELLRASLSDKKKIVTATLISEAGLLVSSAFAREGAEIFSGIITKIQDPGGATRRNLTYLLRYGQRSGGFLSWEMQTLNAAKNLELSSLRDKGRVVSFQNTEGEKWEIPVDKDTKAFLIHFRAHTQDFPRLSFYRALKGDFDPALVKGKVVLLGFTSSLLGDIHNSPLGWIPGLTLNANAFLTLYTHDFIRELPGWLEFIAAVIGMVICSFLVSFPRTKKMLIFIALELFLFFLLSYFLLVHNYTWDYSFFPAAVIILPSLSEKIYRIIKRMRGAQSATP